MLAKENGHDFDAQNARRRRCVATRSGWVRRSGVVSRVLDYGQARARTHGDAHPVAPRMTVNCESSTLELHSIPPVSDALHGHVYHLLRALLCAAMSPERNTCRQ
jgi:hypothetical protein